MTDTAESTSPAVAPETAPDTASPPAKAERTGRKPPRQGKAGAGASTRGNQQRKAPHPVLEKLFELHPQLFGAQFLPLKRGSFQDLMDAHPGVFERDALKDGPVTNPDGVASILCRRHHAERQ